jgi:hypothetical protein
MEVAISRLWKGGRNLHQIHGHTFELEEFFYIDPLYNIIATRMLIKLIIDMLHWFVLLQSLLIIV